MGMSERTGRRKGEGESASVGLWRGGGEGGYCICLALSPTDPVREKGVPECRESLLGTKKESKAGRVHLE